jgi:hypothetical protein
LYEATSHVPGVLANNKYIEMILEPTSCWEALTYCLDMSLEDALKYTFSSGGIKGLTGEQVMADKSLKANVKATMRVHTGAEQEAAKAIANAMT